MRRAAAAVEPLADGFVAAGFSNGGGMAEFVATQRKVSGVLMLSGALPLAMLGVDGWPAGVPAQIHYTASLPDEHQPEEAALLWEQVLAFAPLARGGS